MKSAQQTPVVVGIDGSSAALHAARWAAGAAVLRNARLLILHALDYQNLRATRANLERTADVRVSLRLDRDEAHRVDMDRVRESIPRSA